MYIPENISWKTKRKLGMTAKKFTGEFTWNEQRKTHVSSSYIVNKKEKEKDEK